MLRPRLIALLVVLLALADGAPAALGAGWAKVSGDDVSSIDQAALLAQGPRVIAAWPSGVGSDLAGGVAFRGFAPTPAAPLAGAGPVAAAAAGFGNVSARPGLLAAPDGLHVVTGGTVAALASTYLTPPLVEGQAGGPPTVIAEQLVGAVDAVGLPGGGAIVANMENGDLHVFRDSVPAGGAPVQDLLGGCCSYNPALGRDGAGRVWLAWYSNASGNVGIFLVPIDPATGAPAGAPVKVPQSESPANNGFHLALACSPAPVGGCRIVYGAQASPTAPLRLASWAPGQAAPTNVGGGARLGLGLPLTAAYRADGRLWVAWYDLGTTRGVYAAKLGDARGAGGTVQDLGRPSGFVDARDLESVALGSDLVLAGTVITPQPRASLWTTYVQDPSQVIESPRTIRNGPAKVVAPKGVSIKKLRKTKCVRVRVSVTRPARVLVAIFSGRKSIRVFGRKVVAFRAAGTTVTCVRVPVRAHTFDVRTPARIAIAVRKGATHRSGEPPATVVTKPFRFF